MFWGQRATQPAQEKKRQDLQQIKKPPKATGLQYFSFKKEEPVVQERKRQKSPEYNHFDEEQTQAYGDIQDKYLPNAQAAQRKRISRTYLLQNDVKRTKAAKQEAMQKFQAQLEQKKGLQRLLAEQKERARQRQVAEQLKQKRLQSEKKSAFDDLQALKIEVKSIKQSQLRERTALQQRMHTLNQQKKRQIMSKQKAKNRIAQIEQQRKKVIDSLKNQLQKVRQQSSKESRVFKQSIYQLEQQKKRLISQDLAARNQIQRLKQDLQLLHQKSTAQQKNKNLTTNAQIQSIRAERDQYKSKLRNIQVFQRQYQQSAQKIKQLEYEKHNLLLQKIKMQEDYLKQIDGSTSQINQHFATIQVLQKKLQSKQDQIKKAQTAPSKSGWGWGLSLFSKSQPKIQTPPKPSYLEFGLQTDAQILSKPAQVQLKPSLKKKTKIDFNEIASYQPPPPPKVQSKPAPMVLKKVFADSQVNTEKKRVQDIGIDAEKVKQMNRMSQTQLQWRPAPPKYKIQQQTFSSVQPAQVHLSLHRVVQSGPITYKRSLNQLGVGPQVINEININSLGSGDRSILNPVLMSNGQALIAIAPNGLDTDQPLTLQDYRQARSFHLGQYNSGPPGYFTQRGVRISKQQLYALRDLIASNYADQMPDTTSPIPGSDTVVIVDEYKGQIYLGIRHFTMFKGQLTPTRYGFNITQHQVPKFIKQLDRFLRLLD